MKYIYEMTTETIENNQFVKCSKIYKNSTDLENKIYELYNLDKNNRDHYFLVGSLMSNLDINEEIHFHHFEWMIEIKVIDWRCD